MLWCAGAVTPGTYTTRTCCAAKGVPLLRIKSMMISPCDGSWLVVSPTALVLASEPESGSRTSLTWSPVAWLPRCTAAMPSEYTAAHSPPGSLRCGYTKAAFAVAGDACTVLRGAGLALAGRPPASTSARLASAHVMITRTRRRLVVDRCTRTS